MKPFCFPVNAIQLDRTPPKVGGIIVLGVVVDVIHRIKKFWQRVEDPGPSHQPVKVRGAQTALQVLVFLVPVVLFQEILPLRGDFQLALVLFNGKPVDCEICSKTWQISAVFTVEEKFTVEKNERNI